MKPNVKSIYFLFSVAGIGVYIFSLLRSRAYALNIARHGASTNLLLPLMFIGLIAIGVAGGLWYRSAHPQATMSRQLLVSIITPLALIPVIAVAYVVVALLPLYNIYHYAT